MIDRVSLSRPRAQLWIIAVSLRRSDCRYQVGAVWLSVVAVLRVALVRCVNTVASYRAHPVSLPRDSSLVFAGSQRQPSVPRTGATHASGQALRRVGPRVKSVRDDRWPVDRASSVSCLVQNASSLGCLFGVRRAGAS